MQIVEFDTPYNLLCKEDGVLAELAEQTGEDNLRKLKEIAAISNMKDHSVIREDWLIKIEVDHNTNLDHSPEPTEESWILQEHDTFL